VRPETPRGEKKEKKGLLVKDIAGHCPSRRSFVNELPKEASQLPLKKPLTRERDKSGCVKKKEAAGLIKGRGRLGDFGGECGGCGYRKKKGQHPGRGKNSPRWQRGKNSQSSESLWETFLPDKRHCLTAKPGTSTSPSGIKRCLRRQPKRKGQSDSAQEGKKDVRRLAATNGQLSN